ncbi:MAG: PAS domain S-box protein [Deltaproteobacteria bacterium]|nr:PAS domain S-box protein [Deltaproteobacteria bacterium]MBW2052676.1 PAS domain S-box protein [Deltaproteobacteria bacterium]MBW2141835.1 PAS domain S-box protein [Deltaproteobacteria bacterium]MBW2323630.1 PAS domain S-box protein [Deltaproteobacteria bacterium]
MDFQDDDTAKVEGLKEQKKSAESRVEELEARLGIYQKTLAEIYDLYDTRIEELSLIRRISDSLRNPLDLKELCLELVDIVAHEVTLDQLDLLILDPASEELKIKASFDARYDQNYYYEDDQAQVIPLDHGHAAEATRTGKPVILPPPGQEVSEDASSETLSRLYLPLVARDKTVGLFSLTKFASQPFEDSEVRVLTIISDQAAATLASLRLLDELAQANLLLKESERQARETSLYLESLFEAANDVIFTLDFEGRITYVNRKVEEWGYDKENLISRPLSELVSEPGQAQGLTEQLKAQGTQILELAMRSPAHGRRDVLFSISRLEADSSQDSNYLVLARDITEHKQLEKQLFHSEKLASIGILAAGIAHEIGNPLSAISGYTQILQSGEVSEVETQEYLDAVASQAKRIQRIIENLLDYSRPSAGVRSELNVGETVRTVMSMLGSQRAFKGLEIKFNLSDDLPTVNMDRDHLAQLIINVALNAAQAMQGDGSLEITTTLQEGQIQIRLSDSGPGIPEKIRDRIFDPFFTTKSVGEGTGLGLSICHKIAESYNGGVTFDSSPGQGTVFVISLPPSPEQEEL